MAKILLGVTGGIAAYKACELTRLLVRAGHDVVPLVTPGAERFVRAETFHALARRAPAGDLYPHLEDADLLVVAPLSANTLAKLAHGLGDTVLTEAALAHAGPVLVAPAMNSRMWAHPATQANVRLLQERGVELVGPEAGELAEGGAGVGRMSEPEEIARRVEQALARSTDGSLAGRIVLVTAGGTREPLDSVRFIANRSSGRMGVALATEARRRGAHVTLVAANLAVPPPDGVEVVDAPTAADMADAVRTRAGSAAAVLMAAAVADYRPAEAHVGKRAKDGAAWHLTLEPTTDVLAELGAAERNGQVLVGFAADEGDRGLERAKEKLRSKNLDLIVFNDVGREGIGFDSEDNEVVMVSERGSSRVERAPKRVVAASILDEVERLLR